MRVNKFLTVSAIFAGIALAGTEIYAWGGGPCRSGAWYGGPHWMGNGFFGGGIFMWILTLLLLGTVVFFGVKLFRGQTGVAGKPLDTLKQRLASGEISIEEYNSLKKEL